MMLHPRHRGDCADFFAAPHQTHYVQLDGPAGVIGEIEHAAARAGRTWNTQFTYVLELCLGYHPSDFDDARSVEDWRTLTRRGAGGVAGVSLHENHTHHNFAPRQKGR